MTNVYFDELCESKFNSDNLYIQNVRPDNCVLPCVLFTHRTTRSDVSMYIEDFEDDLLNKKIAICCISDSPYCGLDKSEIQYYSNKYGNLIHFLGYGVPNLPGNQKPDANFISRLKLFIDDVKSPTGTFPPKWQLLYPAAYPEDLVAAYLLLVAEQEDTTLSIKDLDDTNFWKDAGKQFNEEVIKHTITIKDVNLIPSEGWNHPERDDIPKCINLIRSLFEEIEGVKKK